MNFDETAILHKDFYIPTDRNPLYSWNMFIVSIWIKGFFSEPLFFFFFFLIWQPFSSCDVLFLHCKVFVSVCDEHALDPYQRLWVTGENKAYWWNFSTKACLVESMFYTPGVYISSWELPWWGLPESDWCILHDMLHTCKAHCCASCAGLHTQCLILNFPVKINHIEFAKRL